MTKRPKTAPSKTRISSNQIPDSEECAFARVLPGLRDGLKDLRESIENKKDAFSIGYSAALQHVNFIGRIVAFARQLDIALDYQLFLPGRPLQENVRRAHSALWILQKLSNMLSAQIEQLISCLGGTGVIAGQAMGQWAAKDPARKEILDTILKIAVERGRKAATKRAT